MEYEPVIGLEVHVQIKTRSKMFTRAPYMYGEGPNTLTNPVVLALPGTLPVMNLEAIRKTVKMGLIFNCKIADYCKWDRKNYFYPDLPKGYQISQYDKPICVGGEIEVEMPGPSRNIMGKHRKVKITRIHLEEDVGKLSHEDGTSLVDYNRAGAPLAEIVSEPDIFSADEAFAFLTSLKMHLLYAGISDCDMEKGQLRCDANVSIRPKGSTKFGTKVEIKNLNSFSGVRNGIIFEIKRQEKLMQEGNGNLIVQETRRWNAEKGITISMRSKEQAHDYRYFPDPDLMPVMISKEMREEIEKTIPELPFKKQERFFVEYDLPYTITSVLYPDKSLCDYYEEAVRLHNSPKLIGNLLANDLLRELSAVEQEGSLHIDESKIRPLHLANLAKLIDEGIISSQSAKEVLIDMFKTGESPESIVEKKGLKQTANTEELEAICKEAIASNSRAVAEFKSGKENAINVFKGYIMKVTRGKANPKVVDDLLRKLLT